MSIKPCLDKHAGACRLEEQQRLHVLVAKETSSQFGFDCFTRKKKNVK